MRLSYPFLASVFLTSGCSATESVVQFLGPKPEFSHLYTLVDEPGGKTTFVGIVSAPSKEGMLVTEEARSNSNFQDKSTHTVLGHIEYIVKAENGKLSQQIGGESIVILQEPIRSGAPLWTNRRSVIGSGASTDAEETCRVVKRSTEKVIATENDVVTVTCTMEVDEVTIKTTYAFANAIGLIRRIVDTTDAKGRRLGTLTLTLIDIKNATQKAGQDQR